MDSLNPWDWEGVDQKAHVPNLLRWLLGRRCVNVLELVDSSCDKFPLRDWPDTPIVLRVRSTNWRITYYNGRPSVSSQSAYSWITTPEKSERNSFGLFYDRFGSIFGGQYYHLLLELWHIEKNVHRIPSSRNFWCIAIVPQRPHQNWNWKLYWIWQRILTRFVRSALS